MVKKQPAAELLACPKCNKKAIYRRVDGTVRCNRCGYDSAKETQ